MLVHSKLEARGSAQKKRAGSLETTTIGGYSESGFAFEGEGAVANEVVGVGLVFFGMSVSRLDDRFSRGLGVLTMVRELLFVA
jgi:hypothetical protein